MTGRASRLQRLLAVQRKVKALHETRHAGQLALARAARDEALELVARFDAAGSVAMLFPDLYHRRIDAAREREAAAIDAAKAEASRVTVVSLRADAIEREWRKADRAEQRQREDRERLEMIGQFLAR